MATNKTDIYPNVFKGINIKKDEKSRTPLIGKNSQKPPNKAYKDGGVIMSTDQPSHAHIKLKASNLPIPNKYKTLKDTRAKETAPTFPKPQGKTLVAETETPEEKKINYLHIYIDKDGKYPPELIDEIISHLTAEEISCLEYIEYIYKGDFYNPETTPSNEPEYEKFRSVILKIKSNLKNSKSFKEIVDEKGIHSLEEIETIMKTLSPSDQKIIETMFSPDYTKKTFIHNPPNNQYYNIVYRIKELLLINTQSFYECVNQNKRLNHKDIDLIVQALTFKERKLLLTKYKKGLNKPPTTLFDSDSEKTFYSLVAELRREVSTAKTFYELINNGGEEYTKKQINAAVSLLTPAHQKTLKELYGEDLSRKIIVANEKKLYLVEKVKSIIIEQKKEDEKNKPPKQKKEKKVKSKPKKEQANISHPKEKKDTPKVSKTSPKQILPPKPSPKNGTIKKQTTKNKSLYKLIDKEEKYPHELIDEIIRLLPNKKRALLELKYKNGFNNKPTAHFNKETNYEFYSIIRTIRRILKKAKSISDVAIIIKRTSSLYELLKDGRNIPNEVIYKLIENLSENEKKALNDRYQNGFDKPPTEEIPKDKKAFYDGIKRKLKRQLAKFVISPDNEELESFYTLIGKRGDYTKEQIDAVFKLLTKEEQDLINERYGFDLDNPPPNKLEKSKAKKYEFLLGKIRNRLVVNSLPFYIYIDKTGKYSQEIIDKVIASRSPTERASLQARYENGFDKPPTNNLDKELIDECSRIANGIRKRLSGRKSFYEYVDKEKKYTKEEIDRAVERLNQNQRNEINTIFNNNLSQPTLVEGKKNQSRLSYLVKRINTILDESEKKPDFVSIIIYIQEVIEIAKTSNNASSNPMNEFLSKVPTSEISNILDDTEATILYRIYNKKENYAEISKDLNMSEQEIKKIEHSALTKISNYIKTITGVDEDSNSPQEASSSKRLEKNRLN